MCFHLGNADQDIGVKNALRQVECSETIKGAIINLYPAIEIQIHGFNAVLLQWKESMPVQNFLSFINCALANRNIPYALFKEQCNQDFDKAQVRGDAGRRGHFIAQVRLDKNAEIVRLVVPFDAPAGVPITPTPEQISLDDLQIGNEVTVYSKNNIREKISFTAYKIELVTFR